jgi:hypothetical protein
MRTCATAAVACQRVASASSCLHNGVIHVSTVYVAQEDTPRSVRCQRRQAALEVLQNVLLALGAAGTHGHAEPR